MFIIPFLVSPTMYTLEAYKSTRIDMPIMKSNFFFQQTPVYKGSKEYDKAIQSGPGYKIKTEMQSFFDKMGVRRDLIIKESLNLRFCISQGTNFFTKGDAAIEVTPYFYNVDKDACHWLIKHEISHIKNNDCFTIPLVAAISSLATATLSTFLMPVIPALLVTISVGFIAKNIFSQYRKGKADDLAIAESSVEELKGGRRLLIALKENNLALRKTAFAKIIISSAGENRLDFLYPSIGSRLKKIEHALEQQKIEINHQKESKKVVKLKNLMNDNLLRIVGDLDRKF